MFFPPLFSNYHQTTGLSNLQQLLSQRQGDFKVTIAGTLSCVTLWRVACDAAAWLQRDCGQDVSQYDERRPFVIRMTNIMCALYPQLCFISTALCSQARVFSLSGGGELVPISAVSSRVRQFWHRCKSHSQYLLVPWKFEITYIHLVVRKTLTCC